MVPKWAETARESRGNRTTAQSSTDRMTTINKCETKTRKFSFKIFKLKYFHFHLPTLRVTRTGKLKKIAQLSKNFSLCLAKRGKWYFCVECWKSLCFKLLIKNNCDVVKVHFLRLFEAHNNSFSAEREKRFWRKKKYYVHSKIISHLWKFRNKFMRDNFYGNAQCV